MKHYYNDDGILAYTINDRSILIEIANAIGNLSASAYIRSLVAETAFSVLYDYTTAKTIGDPKAWEETPEGTPLRQAIKRLLIDFTSQGFLCNEFLLVAWGAICEIQAGFLLEGLK